MSVELTDREHQIIQQLILDRWNPHRINKKIVDHHRLTINQVKYMRSKPAFKAEYAKQLAIYLDSFDEVGETPKSNVGDLSVLDPDINTGLLSQLNTGIVLIGLNISRGVIKEPFANFHDKSSQATD